MKIEDTWPFGEVEDTFPWWFHDPNTKGINSALLRTKVSCLWDPITETQSCDYTEARKILRGYCERNRDSFYSLSGTMTCASWSWTFTNFPFCQDQYAPNGIIFNIIDSGYFDYETFCTNEFSKIQTMSKIVNNACYENTNKFTAAAGNGDPFYAWELSSAGTCSSYANKEICDYYSLASEFKASCESQGGLMYKWSAREYEIDAFRPGYDIYKNMPVCLSTDCDLEEYFEEYLFLYLSYTKSLYYNGFPTSIFQSIDYDVVDDNPSVVLSPAPSMTPTKEQKIESPDAIFLLRIKRRDNSLVLKKCEWLTQRTPTMIEFICTKMKFQKYKSGYLPASRICFETCRDYCVKQSDSAKFLAGYETLENGEYSEILRRCKWLTKQNEYMIDSYCSSSIELPFDTYYGEAKDVCTTTCGGCTNDDDDDDDDSSVVNCNAHPLIRGDSLCDAIYNVEKCNYDNGDCTNFNAEYPRCNVENPFWIGDGVCHGGAYNTARCGFDGGDCYPIPGYPNCEVPITFFLGDGLECEGGVYNTAACGYDLGDCHAFNMLYPGCPAEYPEYSIGTGYCWQEYNTPECGYDGGDCNPP